MDCNHDCENCIFSSCSTHEDDEKEKDKDKESK